ncbi:unnamed protein product [Strongylus vulgaris]|uniref:Uncharacterized protein n=1 Tax=Strongylus vulgaris TaxID=40348 RepID=A0A3P7JI07_STRVU|nr:unnamed protein product [Strongylus vulgaris]
MIRGHFGVKTSDETLKVLKFPIVTVEQKQSQENTSQLLNREGLRVSDAVVDNTNDDLLLKMGKEDISELPKEDGMDRIRKFFREQQSSSGFTSKKPSESRSTEGDSHFQNVENIRNTVEKDGYHTRIRFKIQ